MKHSNAKRILSLVLMFFMVVSMIVPSYAALPGVLPGGLLGEYYLDAQLQAAQNGNLPGLSDVLRNITNSFYSTFDPFGTYAATYGTTETTTSSSTFAATRAANDTTVYVLAGGDFQEAGDHANSAANVTNILAQVSQKYTTMDGFLFIGDYDCETHNDATETANGITALMEAVQGKYSNITDANSVLAQGNHDYKDSRIDATGGHDFDGYAAYVLNEDDYPNGGGSQSGIQTLANNLKTWLNNKIGEGYTAPIFVVSHLPLAFTPRTVTQGDAKYAKYIFDVLNDAGANGLNIIFLHGHDHAYGPDNYMGGEAIYLAEGDKICIAEAGSTNAWIEETLNFTYMNAGYTGYYSDAFTYDSTAGTDKLTMTVFAITGNEVTVERYSEDGLYNLKSAGRNGSYSDTSVTNVSLGLPTYSTVYASPQTIALEANELAGGATIGNWVGVTPEMTEDVTTSGGDWVTITEPSGGTTTYTYSQADSITAGQDYVIVGNSNDVALMDNNGNMGSQNVTISGSTMTSTTELTEWTFSGSDSGTIYNGTRYLRYNISNLTGTFNLSNSSSTLTFTDNGSNFRIYNDASWDTDYSFYYNGSSWTRSSDPQYVRLYQLTDTTTTGGTNGLYGRLEGELTYNVAPGTSAEDALAAVKAGIAIKYATAADYSDEATFADDGEGMIWTLDPNYDGNVPGDYAVTISYNGVTLGTAEVVVPASTTYYVAEGNGLYLVDMNTSADAAMAAVKAGITVYSATDANGTNKTAIDDANVTWNWVDTYNGADSGPYTVEILYNGTSLGTVEVKVNVKYETGITDGWTSVGTQTGGYKYVLDTDGIDYYDANDSTTQYIIVASNDAYAVNGSGGAAAVEVSSDGSTVTTTTRDYEYHFIRSTYSNTRYELITKGNGSQYLYQESNALHYGTRSSVKFQINHHGNGVYDIHDIDGTNWYIIYSGGWTVVEDTSSRVRLYRYDGEIVGGNIYAKIAGNTVYTVDQGTSATSAMAAVKAGITGYISNNADGSDASELADNELTWKWKNTYASMVTGSYWVEISYNGVVLGIVEVIVEPAIVNNYPEYPDEGAVKVNKTAIYKDEEFRKTGVAQVELSVSGVPSKKGVDVIIMLDTSSSMAYCLNCNDTRHSSYVCDQGGQTRAQVLEETLGNLIKQFQTPGDDGQLLDIDVAIADFNGFYGDDHSETGTPYDRDAEDMMSDDISYTANSEAQIYTGDNTLGAGAFIAAEDLAASYTLNYTSGTNYDYAMDAIYQMATAKKSANGGEDRDLYVLFLTDGAAMQWNGYHSQGNSSLWNSWITGDWDAGDLTTANLNCATHAYYYDEVDHDGDGYINEHRMANAIKGDPSENFEVIRKIEDLGTATAEENMYMVPGLGAKMFSIAFDPRVDGNVTVDSLTKSVATIASDQTGTTQYFYNVSSADELASAFTAIGSEIAYAASNARFVDQMGSAFDLQMASSVTRTVDDEKIELSLTPTIEVKTYDIYTKAEADEIPEGTEGDTVTNSMIGVRKGTFELLEVIMFSDDGTKAYSNKIDVDKDGTYGVTVTQDSEGNNVYTLSDVDDNILGTDGLIYAQTFLYNTGETAVTAVGTTITVAPETFYWKVGTVTTDELAISYYVYLTDTLEGEREAGSYATNNFAILYYDNYLGNECQLSVASPMLPWKAANVSYAFYLVNENGEVIVNQATGQTGTFANKIAVTVPVVFEYIELNNTVTVPVIDVSQSEVLPDGYTVYDSSAVYKVMILSVDSTPAGWEITKTDSLPATTYVTGYNGSLYSNDLTNTSNANDYTHTTVWFAVKWEPTTVPDSVVVDYGLPVDINVLANDVRVNSGTLTGIGTITNTPVDLNVHNAYMSTSDSDFGSSLDLTYGKAEIKDGKVRYTPTTMAMSNYDEFAYEVMYDHDDNSTTTPQYYYGKVTVIPATTIYYEESFVTFTPAKEFSYVLDETGNQTVKTNAGEIALGTWYSVGTAVTGATQAEDRPGEFSLSQMDANNVYGFDGINSSYTKYSLGTARKVTVDAVTGSSTTAPEATFTFTGTGFDVISLTDDDSGVIVVTAENKSSGTKIVRAVDNYYGYSYKDTDNDGIKEWIVDTNSTDTIWQVPVIKFSDLAYGTYNVKIQVAYMSSMDHREDGSYSFWLDSIRIYDPAGTDIASDSVIGGAYIDDGEAYPQYKTLKQYILAAADADTTVNGDQINGVVFIDGNDATSLADDYSNPGPNNETYLANGQSIAFQLKSNSGVAPNTIQIGAKLAYGTSAELMLNGSDFEKLSTATDMYYRMDKISWTPVTVNGAVSYLSDKIVLSNNSDSDTVISLTNVKVTYPDNPTGEITNVGVAAASYAAYSYTAMSTSTASTAATVSDEELLTFVVDVDTLVYAADVVNKLFAEPAHPNVFVPSMLKYTLATNNFWYFKADMLTVVTSTDVENVTVNGRNMTQVTFISDLYGMLGTLTEKLDVDTAGILNGQYKVWTYTTSLAPTEESLYEIIAYNAEGLSSAPVNVPDEEGNTSTITRDDVVNTINRSEIWNVMKQLAARIFNPARFDFNINRTPDGQAAVAVSTSEDVEYVVANDEIIDRYITETVIDLSNNSEKTVSRIWIADVDENVGEIEVIAYDHSGVPSQSRSSRGYN